MKESTYLDVISKLNAEVFTQKAGRLYSPVSQLLALEKRLALGTATLVDQADIPDHKQLERLFWDNVNHAYGNGFFSDEPQWQPNIFIPMRVWELVLFPYNQFFKAHNKNFNFYDFAFITATISAWRYSQPVLKLENDVYKILINDKNGAYVDGFLLHYFMQWTNFIQTPGLKHNGQFLYGFFIHQNEVVFNGVNTKILIIVFSYEETKANIDKEEALFNTDNWNDYVVLRYELDSIQSVQDSLIGGNININAAVIELLGQMFSLFNFTIHPKTDIYNHKGYLIQATYNDTIDSFLSSYRKNKGMPIRRGIGKSLHRREVLYHVHAPSCPRLFETGLNNGFALRIKNISHLTNKNLEKIQWKKTEQGLKLISGQLYSPEIQTKLFQSLNLYFYANNP